MYYLQEHFCTSSKELDCVNNISIDNSSCIKPCSGLIVTSFSKSQENEKLENLFPIIGDYNKYKKITPYPAGLTGNEHEHIFISHPTPNY